MIAGDEQVRGRIEVLNVDRLAYRIVSHARGAKLVVPDVRELRQRWAAAVADAGLPFSAVFLEREWE